MIVRNIVIRLLAITAFDLSAYAANLTKDHLDSVSQSSDAGNNVKAENAVDNDCTNGSISKTLNEVGVNSWLEIIFEDDLNQISTVKVYGNGNNWNAANSIAPADIVIEDADGATVWTGTIDADLQNPEHHQFYDIGVIGKKVTITKTTAGQLSLDCVRVFGLPGVTLAPTAAPFVSPTTEKTLAPVLPDRIPSALPSRQPSDSPSDVPYGSPSSSPSGEPTDIPSDVPSGSPSSSPSGEPTDFPSLQPSSTPSLAPSIDLSDVPSEVPSGMPSTAPSGDPTDMPSLAPSGSPSKAPSGEPSSIPSISPTINTSSTPSLEESEVPSSVPSGSPSKSPSGEPSTKPTSVPSFKPSKSPTGEPSNKPSPAPTSPTNTPTTAAPITAAPTTAPITATPTTSAPITIEPTNVAPTTAQPTTSLPTTTAPTNFPSKILCEEDETFRVNGQRKKDCKYVMKKNKDARRIKLCSWSNVAEACPISCGLCCENDDNYTFVSVLNGNTHNCAWLTQSKHEGKNRRRRRNCQEQEEVQNKCRKACGSCESAN